MIQPIPFKKPSELRIIIDFFQQNRPGAAKNSTGGRLKLRQQRDIFSKLNMCLKKHMFSLDDHRVFGWFFTFLRHFLKSSKRSIIMHYPIWRFDFLWFFHFFSTKTFMPQNFTTTTNRVILQRSLFVLWKKDPYDLSITGQKASIQESNLSFFLSWLNLFSNNHDSS